MTWVAAVDYRRGRAHTSRDLPCQDYGKVEKVAEDIMVGAVADGGGTASLSHIGAKIAVRAATAGLKSSVDRLRAALAVPSEPAATALFAEVLGMVHTALRDVAAQRLVRMQELASTLLVFAAGPGGLAAMQIGHGFIVCRIHGGAYELLFQPGDMSFVRQSLVTGPRAAEEMRVDVRPGPVEFLCAATDGLQPLSIHNADWTPHETFFQKLDHYSAAAGDDGEIHRGIREFLRSDGLNDRIEDDTTLMLCSYRPRGDRGGIPTLA